LQAGPVAPRFLRGGPQGDRGTGEIFTNLSSFRSRPEMRVSVLMTSYPAGPAPFLFILKELPSTFFPPEIFRLQKLFSAR
jgi:hypothetical protein